MKLNMPICISHITILRILSYTPLKKQGFSFSQAEMIFIFFVQNTNFSEPNFVLLLETNNACNDQTEPDDGNT